MTPQDKYNRLLDLIVSLGGRAKFIDFACDILTINGKPISRAAVDKWLSGNQPIPDITLELLELKLYSYGQDFSMSR